MRDQLGPLAELAERTNVALSAVTYPPKNAGPSALDHFIGSQAFVAAARLAHLAVDEVEQNAAGKHAPTGRRLFTSIEKNVTGKLPAVAYRIAPVMAGDIRTTKVAWEGVVDISADDALAAAQPKKDKEQKGPVVFLMDMLAAGPVQKQIVLERATAHGFSEDQLDRASARMGVVKRKDGFQGPAVWCLPQHAGDGEQL